LLFSYIARETLTCQARVRASAAESEIVVNKVILDCHVLANFITISMLHYTRILISTVPNTPTMM